MGNGKPETMFLFSQNLVRKKPGSAWFQDGSVAIPIGVWLDVLVVRREDVPSTSPCTWHANPGVYCRLVGLPSVVYDASTLCGRRGS